MVSLYVLATKQNPKKGATEKAFSFALAKNTILAAAHGSQIKHLSCQQIPERLCSVVPFSFLLQPSGPEPVYLRLQPEVAGRLLACQSYRDKWCSLCQSPALGQQAHWTDQEQEIPLFPYELLSCYRVAFEFGSRRLIMGALCMF